MGNQQGLSHITENLEGKQNQNDLQSPNPEITVNTVCVSFKMFSDVHTLTVTHLFKKLSIHYCFQANTFIIAIANFILLGMRLHFLFLKAIFRMNLSYVI